MYKILLVDDDAAVLSIIERKVRQTLKKTEIRTAFDFGGALADCAVNSYDLVIVDNNLTYPGEGEDLARQISVLPGNSDAELWVVSGDFHSDSSADGLRLLPKPICAESERHFYESLKKWKRGCDTYLQERI